MMYIDKLDDMVDEYNNTYHRAIKMKPNDVNDNTYIDIDKEFNDNDPNFKAGISCKNIKIRKPFLLKAILQIGLKKSLSLKKLIVQFHGSMLLMILMVKKLLEHFMKKKLLKEKVINYMSNERTMVLIAGPIKKS